MGALCLQLQQVGEIMMMVWIVKRCSCCCRRLCYWHWWMRSPLLTPSDVLACRWGRETLLLLSKNDSARGAEKTRRLLEAADFESELKLPATQHTSSGQMQLYVHTQVYR